MKCYIYKIENKTDNEQFYIGSTLNLSRRKSHHKKNVKNKVGKLYWCKLYVYIRNHGGWDNFNFTKIDEIEINLLSEGTQYEQSIIDELKPTLNSIKANKTYKDISI
jgi:hypothetical protein